MNTVDLLFFVVNTYQTVSIMVTTVHEDEQQVLNCIESGATGFFLKDSLK
jgi:DNA-binding NarL/FixJ family response regulator